MKRLICLLSTVLFLFCAVSCSGGGSGTLGVEEFNVYQDGKVYLAVEDIQLEENGYQKLGEFEFGAEHETKRGLKVGDTVTRVKELYGNETTYDYSDYSSENPMPVVFKVSEYINQEQEKDESYIFFDLQRKMFDGKVVDMEQIEPSNAFGSSNEYMGYSLNIRIENSVVTVISVSVVQYTIPPQS